MTPKVVPYASRQIAVQFKRPLGYLGTWLQSEFSIGTRRVRRFMKKSRAMSVFVMR